MEFVYVKVYICSKVAWRQYNVEELHEKAIKSSKRFSPSPSLVSVGAAVIIARSFVLFDTKFVKRENPEH